MSGRVYTLKPNLSTYRPPLPSKSSPKNEQEKISFKERIVEAIENFLLLIGVIAFLVSTVGILYKSFVYFQLRSEKNRLMIEKNLLEKELNKMTSQEVLMNKSRALGFRAPTQQDIINLR